MGSWITLKQRRKNFMKSMSDGVSVLRCELSSYALDNGGRFIIFGSVARGDFRPDSDIDILVDFPKDKEADAWRFAEDTCAKNGLKADARSIIFCRKEFVEHIMKDAEIIYG